MAAQCIRACEATPAAPSAAMAELAFADKLFLARMEAFVPLAVMLAGEGFATDGADEGALVGVGPEVRAEIVGAGEALGAETALKGGGVLLDAVAC